MDFRAKQAKSIPGSPAAVHTPPFTWEAEQADRFRGPLRRWQPLSSLSAGQGECPAHVAGMLGVQTRQHHGSTLLSVTPPPPDHNTPCPAVSKDALSSSCFPGTQEWGLEVRADVALQVSPARLPLSIHQSLIHVPLVPPLVTPRHWEHSRSVAGPGQNEQERWGQLEPLRPGNLALETELQSITPRSEKAAKGIDKRVPSTEPLDMTTFQQHSFLGPGALTLHSALSARTHL